jgi:hypothetical protein
MGAYSGALLRTATAHYASRPSVPGVDPRHEHPDPQPDPFDPKPDTPAGQTGDVWQDQEQSNYTEMRAGMAGHTAQLQPPVPSNVYGDQRDTAWQDRWLTNHAVEAYRPDLYAPYKHAEQGLHIQYVEGREPQNAGSTVPDDMAYLVMGRNSYDQTNQPNEVYGSGGESNVGRYRLGVRIEDWGLYEYHLPQGQDAELRAYTGLQPAFPVDKPPVENPAPYTPSSSGTARWNLPAFQDPSMFALPSETSMTDYMIASDQDGGAPASEFDDGGRM